jgi:hypothetical protein
LLLIVRCSVISIAYISIVINNLAIILKIQRVYDQTWIFVVEHSVDTNIKRLWKFVISSRETGLGSGRNSPAENEALAIAN